MDCDDRINNTGTNFNNSKAHLKAKFSWNISILRLNLDDKYNNKYNLNYHLVNVNLVE